MSYTISIDCRENVLRPYFGEECFKNLDIADIIIKKDDEILVAIERKTIDDLKASVIDGRWREQKLRLTSNIQKKRIIYLIEGNILKKTSIKGGSDTLIGSLINAMLRDDIKIYKTANLAETVSFINKIYKSVQEKYEIFFDKDEKEKDYLSTINVKKKDNHTPKLWYRQMLSAIPQLSLKIADCIIDKYPSINDLINNSTQNELQNLSYVSTNGKNRKVGPKLAERIKEYINY